MTQENNLNSINTKANRIATLTKVTDDLLAPLEDASHKFDRREQGAGSILAYETSRVLEQLIELNYIVRDLADEIGEKSHELQRLGLKPVAEKEEIEGLKK